MFLRVFVVCAALCAVSCLKENTVSINHGRAIDFRASVGKGTRAVETTSANLRTFYVTALRDVVLDPDAEQDADTEIAPYFSDVEFFEVDGFYCSDTYYYWPNDGSNLSFFAWAPSAETLGGSVDITNAGQTLNGFSPAASVAAQLDFVVATAAGNKTNAETGVELTFEHALSQVAVTALNGGENVVKVKGCGIRKVYGNGNYDFATAKWSDTSSKTDYNIAYDDALTLTSTAASLMGAEGTAMLIPQQLTAWDAKTDVSNTKNGAWLGVYINLADEDGHVMYPRGGGADDFAWIGVPVDTEWESGKKYLYTLDFSNGAGYTDPDDPEAGKPVLVPIDFSLSVSNWDGLPSINPYTAVLEVSTPDAVSYAGGTATFTVKSCGAETTFWNMAEPTPVKPLAWSAAFYGYNEATGEYDIELDEAPAWISGFPTSGEGSLTGEELSFTVAAQTGVAGPAEYEFAANPVPNYNLSNSTGADAVENTANCYVIDKSGTYRLPLVYGNAIKNGVDNTDAYNPGTVEGGLSTFVDHADAPITGPYIYDKYTPASATLVWQDAENLVTDVALSADNHFLTFNVAAATITGGNAVVAVRDASNTILWSWHIWVTADDLTPKAVTNYMNEVNNIMPVNLGWVSTSITTYAACSCKVRFSQAGTTNTKVLTISQTAGSSSEGNSPFYQWGRKDPFLPSNGTGNTDKTVSGTKWTYQASTTATIGTDIQNPTIHYYNSSTRGACNTQYNNLWSAKNTKTNVAYNVADETVIKTVYDPCPAGFTVAPTNAYTGFSTTGQNTSTSGEFNVNGAFAKGWNFYCGKNKTGATIFFPAAGYRNYSSGALGRVPTRGCYWAAVPNSTTFSRTSAFSSTSINMLDNYYRAYGCSVRPVQEK